MVGPWSQKYLQIPRLRSNISSWWKIKYFCRWLNAQDYRNFCHSLKFIEKKQQLTVSSKTMSQFFASPKSFLLRKKTGLRELIMNQCWELNLVTVNKQHLRPKKPRFVPRSPNWWSQEPRVSQVLKSVLGKKWPSLIPPHLCGNTMFVLSLSIFMFPVHK